MSLEEQIAGSIAEGKKVYDLVVGKFGEWDNSVKNQIKKLEDWKSNLANTDNNYSYYRKSDGQNVKMKIISHRGIPISDIRDISCIVQIKTNGTSTTGAYTVAHYQRGSTKKNKSLTGLCGQPINKPSSNRPYLTFDDNDNLCFAIDHSTAYSFKIAISKTYGE